MRALLHLADISHGIKPPALHVEWSSRITQEFFDEGRQQRELGMTPLKLMDATCSYVPYNQVSTPLELNECYFVQLRNS